MPQNYLSWSAPEFNYYRKEKSWFLIMGAIAAGLFLWALLTKNFLFALLIGLSYFSIATFALRKPKEVQLTITAKGIEIDQTFYSFANLRSFWIFYQPPEVKEISLRSKKIIMPYIKIPLGEQDPAEVKEILLKYLPEKKHKESLIENLARSLRF